jgi:hypothetical protein
VPPIRSALHSGHRAGRVGGDAVAAAVIGFNNEAARRRGSYIVTICYNPQEPPKPMYSATILVHWVCQYQISRNRKIISPNHGLGRRCACMSKLQDQLSYAPRGMRAERAAAYLDMGRTKFLELVDSGRLPKPVEIDGVRVWCRHDLDSAFEDLKKPTPDRVNSFDVLMGRK